MIKICENRYIMIEANRLIFPHPKHDANSNYLRNIQVTLITLSTISSTYPNPQTYKSVACAKRLRSIIKTLPQ